VIKTLLALAALAALTTGCAGLLDSGQPALGGSLATTPGGAAISSIAGDTGWGVVSGSGAAGGSAYDKSRKAQQ